MQYIACGVRSLLLHAACCSATHRDHFHSRLCLLIALLLAIITCEHSTAAQQQNNESRSTTQDYLGHCDLLSTPHTTKRLNVCKLQAEEVPL
jgi:hypothetical protein